ncbi:CHY zinc finger protein [Alkalicoccus urumqiensis]|uniref:CHY zinc finger protein n=1 Tax=Alkalicoccus urumqiensis TaxID=1548213 RepID=UPI001AECCACD|nr:CHY zinc finger protein [Alkalicoccus urumqiensis]
MDNETRCRHYNGPLDRIALKCSCCDTYYSCAACHEEHTGRAFQPIPETEMHVPAVLCGSCQNEMTPASYISCGDQCPHCRAPFNPGCKNHYAMYFSWKSGGVK